MVTSVAWKCIVEDCFTVLGFGFWTSGDGGNAYIGRSIPTIRLSAGAFDSERVDVISRYSDGRFGVQSLETLSTSSALIKWLLWSERVVSGEGGER
jgi:hypothetical protein